jgi:hypothetical protein
MPRKATPKQSRLLLALGSGATVLAPRRGEWMPLLRREWVERDPRFSETPSGGYLPPLRITPDGLRALADALERDGGRQRRRAHDEPAERDRMDRGDVEPRHRLRPDQPGLR